MKRLIDYHLRQWKDSSIRQPLLLRGARQVGKTHAARELGKSFSSFVEINLEENEDVRKIFESLSAVHNNPQGYCELSQIYRCGIGVQNLVCLVLLINLKSWDVEFFPCSERNWEMG